MIIKKEHANKILEEIKALDMKPVDFFFFNDPDKPFETYLKHKATNYYFLFTQTKTYSTYVEFSPGENNVVEERTLHRGGWRSILSKVKWWLKYLKKEISTIDKWCFLDNIDNKSFLSISNLDTSKFTSDELEFIKNKFNEIKVNISEIKTISKSEILALHEAIDELEDNANELSRKDWKIMFYTIAFASFKEIALSTENIEIIWNIIVSAFTIVQKNIIE